MAKSKKEKKKDATGAGTPPVTLPEKVDGAGAGLGACFRRLLVGFVADGYTYRV